MKFLQSPLQQRILVLGGITEARMLAEKLAASQFDVTLSVVYEHGRHCAEQNHGFKIRVGALNTENLIKLLRDEGFTLCIDATHPFATQVSDCCKKACQAINIPLIRYSRPLIPPQIDACSSHPCVAKESLINSAKLIWVDNHQEAAQQALEFCNVETGERAFLTVGIRNLHIYAKLGINSWVVRVLPTQESINHALSLGFSPKQLVALHPPFSLELEQSLIQWTNSKVMVTKASGNFSGFETKIKACANLSIPLICVLPTHNTHPEQNELIFSDIATLVLYVARCYKTNTDTSLQHTGE